MRPREEIEQELKEGDPIRTQVDVIAEILLDIREHLGKLAMHQGVQKWGAKIGPSAVETVTAPSSTTILTDPGSKLPDGPIRPGDPDRYKARAYEFGGQNREHKK